METPPALGGQDSPDQSLCFAVDGPLAVEADEPVGEQGGQSVHGGPDDEFGSGARRGRQAAGAGSAITSYRR